MVPGMSSGKLIAYALGTVATFGVLLFPPAGTFDWWRAWVFLGIVFIGSVWSTASVARVNPAVFEVRRGPIFQKAQPLADKVVVLLLITAFVGAIVFIPLDVFRFHHRMGKPGPLVSTLGLLLIVAGWCVIVIALRANAFAAAVVKHMPERGHTVVDRCPYSVVRHPIYAGAALFLVGIPLWLESYAGALVSLVAVFVLAARIVVEERFLVRNLPGYDDYRRRVRDRLIPLLW